MQDLFLVCNKIAKVYSSYNQSESDINVLRSFNRMRKVLKTFGYEDENILKSLARFKKKYGKIEEEWFKEIVVLNLYNEEKLVKGPALHLTKIYRMACKIDRKEKTDLRHELTESLLSLLEKEPNLQLVENILFAEDEELRKYVQVLSSKKEFGDVFSWFNKEIKKKPLREVLESDTLEKLIKSL